MMNTDLDAISLKTKTKTFAMYSFSFEAVEPQEAHVMTFALNCQSICNSFANYVIQGRSTRRNCWT